MDAVAERPLESRTKGVIAVAGGVSVMWVQEIADQVFDADWDRFGIRPRSLDGLEGIVTSPFLHDGFGHLISNSVPLLVLGVAIAMAGLARLLAVTGIAALVGGGGTWLLAPGNTNHIGASGLVFGFAAYLLARGLYSRRLAHMAIGVAVAVVYGTALLGGLIPTDGDLLAGPPVRRRRRCRRRASARSPRAAITGAEQHRSPRLGGLQHVVGAPGVIGDRVDQLRPRAARQVVTHPTDDL